MFKQLVSTKYLFKTTTAFSSHDSSRSLTLQNLFLMSGQRASIQIGVGLPHPPKPRTDNRGIELLKVHICLACSVHCLICIIPSADRALKSADGARR